MQLIIACVSSLFAPVFVTAAGARLSSVTHDDHNKENKQKELLLASSSFSKLKIADRFAIYREVHQEPNKIKNIDDDVKDNKKKNSNPNTGTPDSNSGSDGKEECVPPVTFNEFSKLDFGHLSLSSCSAIQSQSLIGWRHLLSGKISQEWLKLQETSTKVTIGRKRLSYVWGASLAKVLLKQFIKLWELRNEEVHGKTAELQEQIRKDKLGKVVRQLNELRDQARPSDMCLFHSDMKSYIEKSNAQSIASYISSHKKAIANSIKEWAGASHVGIASIVDWIRNNNSSEQIDRIYSRQRRGLPNESGKKERLRIARARRAVEKTRRQASIVGY